MHTQTGRGTAPFEWVNGTARYRALPVEHRRITIASDAFDITALKDAAALLDNSEFVQECEKTDRLPYYCWLRSTEDEKSARDWRRVVERSGGGDDFDAEAVGLGPWYEVIGDAAVGIGNDGHALML